MNNPLRDTQKSSRHIDVEFDTPFNSKGVCHHHPNVQMATKKFNGGWKILMTACPRCIEAKYDEDVESVASSRCSSRASSKRSSRSKSRSRQVDEDEGSVSSRSSKRSVTSRTQAINEAGTFDKNGCCTCHPTVQVAKKKLLGGWKEFRQCPKCIDPSYDDMADNASVCSKSSRRSTTSFRSTGSTRSKKSARSVKSNSSRKGGRKNDRYGALPFDEEGYCHAHPSVRLAKKKALGGWKVLHDICPDCAQDCESLAGSTRSGRSGRSRSSKRSSSKKKGTGRVFDDSGSDTSSYKSGKSSRSTSSRKKKIRVKDMRYTDENGKEGRYSGDVNDDHQPHGSGKMKYKDGSVFNGVWSEGSSVHGKTTKKSSRSSGSSVKSSDDKSRSSSRNRSRSKKSSSGDWENKQQSSGTSVANTVPASNMDSSSTAIAGNIKVVRKMKWLDYYGDPGEFTGEVDTTAMLPHGRGSMKYDHGLVSEGCWANGQFVEGSELNLNRDPNPSNKKKSSSSKSSSKKKSSSSRSGGERSKKSSSSSASRGTMDP